MKNAQFKTNIPFFFVQYISVGQLFIHLHSKMSFDHFETPTIIG